MLRMLKRFLRIIRDHSELYLAGRSLDKLESANRFHFLQNLIQRHRGYANAIAEFQNVIGPAFDLQPQSGPAAFAFFIVTRSVSS